MGVHQMDRRTIAFCKFPQGTSNQRSALSLSAAASLVLVCFIGSVDASNVYRIVPRLLPGEFDDYTVTGTIETDGTVGVLAPENIVDFDVIVDGLVPYRFRLNTGSSIGATAVHASKTVLEIPRPERGTNSLSITAFDNTPMECDDCFQGISWAASENIKINPTAVSYRYTDRSDYVPTVKADLLIEGKPTIVVATIVPEPTSLGILLCGLFLVLNPVYRSNVHKETNEERRTGTQHFDED